jgi:hypothetical protein
MGGFMFKAASFKLAAVLLTVLFTLPGSLALAQQVEVTDQGQTPVGRARAEKYFQARQARQSHQDVAQRSPAQSSNGNPRYLALHIGTFFDDQSYNWTRGNHSDRARLNLGVTYRMGEWVNSMDFLLRSELTTYKFDEGDARKLSFIGMITFPDANSKFPLYFGAGLGPGVFIKQLHNKSVLTLDYQLVAGARFFNVIDTIGFSVEIGMKNHFHLLSGGQFNGLAITVGTVFSF